MYPGASLVEKKRSMVSTATCHRIFLGGCLTSTDGCLPTRTPYGRARTKSESTLFRVGVKSGRPSGPRRNGRRTDGPEQRSSVVLAVSVSLLAAVSLSLAPTQQHTTQGRLTVLWHWKESKDRPVLPYGLTLQLPRCAVILFSLCKTKDTAIPLHTTTLHSGLEREKDPPQTFLFPPTMLPPSSPLLTDRIAKTCWVWLLLVLVTLLPVAAETSGTFTGAANNHINNSEGLVSIPLVPHAVQRRRLLQEQGTVPEELVPDRPHRYEARRRQLLGDSDNPTPVSELFQGYGTHYADLWCGTPAQRQTVIVDTGSGVTAFPCSECQNCGVPKYHSDGLFVEEMSSTFETLDCSRCLRGHCRGSDQKCSISMSYAEGSSWSAFEALDNCYVGGLHSGATEDDKGTDFLDPFHAPAFSFGLKFGCQTHLTGLFITQVCGHAAGIQQQML